MCLGQRYRARKMSSSFKEIFTELYFSHKVSRIFYFEIPMGSISFKRILMRSGLKIINATGPKSNVSTN